MRILTTIAAITFFVAGQASAEEGSGNVLALTGGPESGPERSAKARSAGIAHGKGAEYTIDFVSDGSGTAMDFAIKIEGGARTRVDDTNCVAGLPSTHTGDCHYQPKSGILKVVVFSPSNAPLNTGSIGSIRVVGAKNVSIDKDSLTVASPEGSRVSADVL